MTRRRQDRDAGFTLMEVLAALLIFSVSAVGLMGSVRQSVRLSTEAELKTYGGIVAENVVAQLKHPSLSSVSDLINASSVSNLADTEGTATILGQTFDWVATRSFHDEADLMVTDVDILHEDRVVASRTYFQPRTTVRVNP